MNEKSTRGMDYFHRVVETPSGPAHACAVCGQGIMEAGSYEICQFCGWEDDPVQNADPNFCGGANQMSLTQARTYWKAIHKRVICGNGSPEMNAIQQLAISVIEKKK